MLVVVCRANEAWTWMGAKGGLKLMILLWDLMETESFGRQRKHGKECLLFLALFYGSLLREWSSSVQGPQAVLQRVLVAPLRF